MNWNTEDTRKIIKIVFRAEKLLSFKRHRLTRLSLTMDLEACHLNGCPLALDELLAAADVDFTHDVLGISSHIDRETGQLTNFFSPRYAAVYHRGGAKKLM
jgi:hypothetical protein